MWYDQWYSFCIAAFRWNNSWKLVMIMQKEWWEYEWCDQLPSCNTLVSYFINIFLCCKLMSSTLHRRFTQVKTILCYDFLCWITLCHDFVDPRTNTGKWFLSAPCSPNWWWYVYLLMHSWVKIKLLYDNNYYSCISSLSNLTLLGQFHQVMVTEPPLLSQYHRQ